MPRPQKPKTNPDDDVERYKSVASVVMANEMVLGALVEAITKNHPSTGKSLLQTLKAHRGSRDLSHLPKLEQRLDQYESVIQGILDQKPQ